MNTALDALRTKIQKEIGKETLLDKDSFHRNERYTISSPSMSYLLGGGIPKGKIVEIYGVEAGGKSAIAEAWCADLQQQGKVIAYIDAENSFDPDYAKKAYGLDVFNEELAIFSQPESGEEALNLAEKIASSGLVSLIIIDSVAALTPIAELEGSMGDQQMGLQARLIGKALRKLKGMCNQTGTTIVFINQLRQKLGAYGNPDTTPGGLALKYFSSIRMDVRKVEPLRKGEEVYGHTLRVKTVKNKTAMPFKKIEQTLIYGDGFDYTGEYITYAIANNLIEKSGSWFTIGTERVQGMERVKTYLEDNPIEFQKLKDQVNSLLGIQLGQEEIANIPQEEPKKKKKTKSSKEDTELDIAISTEEVVYDDGIKGVMFDDSET